MYIMSIVKINGSSDLKFKRTNTTLIIKNICVLLPPLVCNYKP